MGQTKHDTVVEFFEDKVRSIAGNFHFNFSPENMGQISFITNYSDNVRKKYVRSAEKEYGFSIILTKEYSQEEDTVNLEAMNFCQAIIEMIESLQKAKEYPDFGGNCQVKKIESIQNMGNLVSVNMEENLARYMVQGRIIYHEKEITA